MALQHAIGRILLNMAYTSDVTSWEGVEGREWVAKYVRTGAECGR